MTAGLADWRTSSYSGPQGNCVEVGWRKSSYSGQSGSCVEVGATPEVVGVRDTKDRAGGALIFDHRAWTRFLRTLKS